MVNKSKSQVKPESNAPQVQIVETAVRRFSHFGIAKTTLTEVAEDLAISKQVLAYYFPDKQSLVDAVVGKLTEEYFKVLEEALNLAPTVEAALFMLTTVKGNFFKKYFMVTNQAEQIEIIRNPSLGNWRKALAEKELILLTALFEKGIQRGELKALDPHKTGSLLLDTLYAFSRCIQDKNGIPDPEAFTKLFESQQEVIRLFYYGLKAEKVTHPSIIQENA